MTVIDQFVKFTQALDDEQRRALEDDLKLLMERHIPIPPDDWELSPAQLAELDRRMADPNPKYADPAQVAKLLGTTEFSE